MAYAFWPLQLAYADLTAALKTGNYDKIRQAEQHYSEIRAFSDGMMKTMGKYKTPLCGGNFNSTRGEANRTAVPREHLADYVTHAKLNDPEQMTAEDKKRMWGSNPIQL